MSSVTYGNVALALIKTNSLDQEPIYTDDGMDYLYTRFVLDVTCQFNADVMSGGETPTQIMNAVRASLLEPRKQLLYRVGVETLLQINVPDSKGGPFPRKCTISRIDGTSTFRVDWACEAYATICAPATPAISNRWSSRLDYDKDFFTTRSTTGKLSIVPQAVETPVDLDQFRSLVMPPLPEGWQRDRISFAAAQDGLSLSYEIVDKEVNVVAPRPATSAQAEYKQIVDKFGGRLYGSMSVTLRGANETPRVNLISKAAEIIHSRINAGDIIESTDVTESVFENQITMSVSWLRAPKQDVVVNPGVIIDQFKFGTSVPGSSSPAIDLNERTGLLKHAIAAFKASSCQSVGAIPASGYLSEQSAGTTIESTVVPTTETTLDPYTDPKYSAEHKTNMYIECQADIEYHEEYNRVMLPSSDSGQLSSFIATLGGPLMKVMVKWRNERYGAWPKGLTANLGGGWVVLKNKRTSEVPQLAADGRTFIYALKGEMEIALQTFLTEQANLPTGKLPYTIGSETSIPGGSQGIWTSALVFG